MGLDIYVHKVIPLTQEEVAPFAGEPVYELPFSWEPIDEDGFPPGYEEIRKFGQIIRAKLPFTRLDKIRKDAGIPEDSFLGGDVESEETCSFRFFWKTKDGKRERETVDIPKEQVLRQYTEYEDSEIFVYVLKNICYWRKYYHLMDEIDEVFPGEVQNSRYHILTPEVTDILCRLAPQQAFPLQNAEKDDIFVLYASW